MLKIRTIYDLKPAFQGLLRPISNYLNSVGVSANQVTLLACILSIVMGLLPFIGLYSIYWYILPIFMFIRMALNAIDGLIAKEHNQISKIGGFYNELGDIVSDSAILISFLAISSNLSMSVILFLAGSILTEASGLASSAICGHRSYNGPMGKSDRAFVLGLVSILFAFGLISVSLINLVFVLCFALTIFTSINRVKAGIQYSKNI